MISANSFPESTPYSSQSTPIVSSTIKSTTPLNRPSSPRQFFERLYGHLETSSSVNTSISDAKTNVSPIQSEISSSPEFLDER